MIDAKPKSHATTSQPDENFRAKRCGTAADLFDDMYQVMRWSCATPALAVYFAREGKSFTDAQRRLRELN